MPPSGNPAIILIGKTGAGKSEYGTRLHNYLTKTTEEVFKVGNGLASQTTDAVSRTITIGNETYDLVDMPGYMDTSGSDKETIKEIARIIENCSNGIMAFLFVIKYAKITLEERHAIRWVKTYFGSGVIPNVILVISHVNKNHTKNRDQLREAFKIKMDASGTGNPLEELIQEVKERWVISPNADIFDFPDDEYWHRELDLLKGYIESIKKPYTNDKFKYYREKKELENAKNRQKEEEDAAKIQELEQEITRLKRLAREDKHNQARYLEAVKGYEKRIDNIKQEARNRERKSKAYLKHYVMALSIVVAAGAAIATLPTTTVAAVVAAITGLCVEVKIVEVFFMVAELMPQYSEQIREFARDFFKL